MPQQPELDVPAHLMPGVRLQHYKGGLYLVGGACLIEVTLEIRFCIGPNNATRLIGAST